MAQTKNCTQAVMIETLFRTTAQSIPEVSLWMKYEPDQTKEKENMLQTNDVG